MSPDTPTSNSSNVPLHCQKIVVLALILLFQCFHIVIAEEEDISWEQAATEVDSLPFTEEFIDSIKREVNFSPDNRSLRSIKTTTAQQETLVYEISWGPFKAGYVILSTEFIKSNNTIRLGGKGLSNNFVGAFYKMRDYNISTIDADGLYPLLFEEHLREGKNYKADRWMLFDNSLGKLHIKGKSFKTLDAPKFTHDYLSMLHFVRSMNTAPGDTFTLSMYTDSKIHPISFTCGENTTVEVPSGIFKCIKIVPKLAGDAPTFNKKDKLEVLISNDAARIPVQIKSKIKFGSITAKLIWHTN